MSHFPQDPSSPRDLNDKSFELACRICGKPVPLSNAKTDGDGKPVHEDCYTDIITKNRQDA